MNSYDEVYKKVSKGFFIYKDKKELPKEPMDYYLIESKNLDRQMESLLGTHHYYTWVLGQMKEVHERFKGYLELDIEKETKKVKMVLLETALVILVILLGTIVSLSLAIAL